MTHVEAGGWARLLDDLEAATAVEAPEDRLLALGVIYPHFAALNPSLFLGPA